MVRPFLLCPQGDLGAPAPEWADGKTGLRTSVGLGYNEQREYRSPSNFGREMEEERMVKKGTVVFLILLVAWSAVLGGCSGSSSVQPESRPLADYQGENPAAGGRLSVQGGRLVDESGQEIVLRGVNLGNWMLMETWMSCLKADTQDWGYYDTLALWTERFGQERTYALIQAYEEHFITESDLAQIEKLGFNCVRVPFWYRNFMNEDGAWLTEDPAQNPGFQRLDWLIDQCRQHNIYVILDLHGAPGGQSTNHSTGKAGRNTLYTSQADMDTAVRLWQGIAGRYCGEPVVAAYDLLNEPQNNGDTQGVNNWEAESDEAVEHTNAAYDTLYQAVRAVDPDRIISIEGIWSTKVLPDPAQHGYTNMLYQLHLYDTSALKIRFRVREMVRMREDWGVALLVGEYNNGEKEAYANGLYQENNISTTKWTYKTFNVGKQWGIFNKDMDRLDIQTASYEEILTYFQHDLATDSFTFNAAEMAAIA